MHHLVVSVDGSEWSQVAARYALDFARARQEEIVALAVIPPEIMKGLTEPLETLAYSTQIPEGEQLARRAVNDWFAGTEKLCADADVCFLRSIEVGDPAERLTWAALTAHLLVLGAHGANAPAVTKGSLGKTARALLDGAVKPLLITRETYKPIQTVVLGWDGHPDAAHAAEMIFDAAKAGGWHVYVVSGAEESSPVAESCGYLADEMARGGVEATAYLDSDNAPDVIFKAVEKFGADLVAIGGRQKSATRHLLRGNAWWDLVEQLSVPVLLYR